MLFLSGEWSFLDDVLILSFAEANNGSKWSKLAKNFPNRTQHSVKNRFFTLLCCYSNLPIRTIKQEKAYKKTTMISDALAYHKKFLKSKDLKIKKEETMKLKIKLEQ